MATHHYTTTIGTITNGGQVHLAHGTHTQHVLCRFGDAKEATTATIAETNGDTDICDALLVAEVKMSKLCRHCFPAATRSRYRARIRRAITETDD